jgi:acyl carrier protein
VWQELLRIDQIGVDDDFFELGGNSLVGLNLISKLRSSLGLTIPAYALYQAPSVGAIARFVSADETDSTLEERRDRGEMRRRRTQQRREHSLLRR